MKTDDLPIVPIGVKSAPFTLNLFARDCPPLQFLREFTRNGVEAIEAYRAAIDHDYRGEVIWTFDRNLYELTGQTKLACIDTGIGMSAQELPGYINELAASGKSQGLADNYGIGAKVSAAPGNPRGVIYCTWRDGAGSMVELGRDEYGVWGMRQHRLADGSVVAVVPLEDAARPPELGGLDHGTMVVFLGESDEHDTTHVPSEAENGEKWIAKALNQRFYILPECVEVKARETKAIDESEYLRTVRGQRYFLDQHSIAAGTVQVTGAKVHWRILDANHKERAKQASVWASTGHRAALFQDELFELATAARGGYRRVQEFGIRFGYERVVLYVEPETADRQVTADTARTRVLIDGQPLPWESCADEFEANMPRELRRFQEEIASGSSAKDHTAAIRERLNTLRELFKIPRYRPHPEGTEELDQPNAGGKPVKREEEPQTTGGSSGGRGGRTGNVYALFEKRGGDSGERAASDTLPEIEPAWVTVKDGTRTAPHLEDRAARYDQRHNRLEINADFRGYRDMVNRWIGRYPGVPGAPAVIEDTVAQWWEQALTETVLGVLALGGSQYWNERVISEGLSEVALTAAVMQRYHLDATLRRELRNKLGATKVAA
jgi:hypothetical protein